MESQVPSLSGSNGTPPIAFVVAVWLGMSHDEILQGLADGSIAPPPGSPPGWTPPDWDVSTTGSGTGTTDPPDGGLAPPESSPGSGGDGTGSQPSRTTVAGWLRAIDPAVSNDTIDKLWQTSGSDDASRGAFWRDYLGRVLGVPTDTASSSGSLDASITTAAAAPSHRATLLSLAGRSGAELAELAKGDAGVRYALDRNDPVALTGNRSLAAANDPTGELDRFDPNTGERMQSDDFIGDRAKLAAWKLRRDAGGDLAIEGDARWTFVDRAHVGADGKPLTLTLEGTQAGAATIAHQVVFGGAGVDVIAGGAADDRLYGASGDDVLKGGGGSDRLEGGRGDDTLIGGRGDDALAGGAGDDDVDGGAGADALEGGSGDDALTGGRGDDTLDGGRGNDTYAFESGDGHDTIVDADGRGTVVLDDVQLNGAATKRGADGMWHSEGSHVDYQYREGGDGSGVLSIRSTASEADEIRILGWRNGDLGISLGDGTAHTLTSGSDASDTGNAARPTLTPLSPDTVPSPGTDEDPLAADSSIASSVPDPAGTSSDASAAAPSLSTPPDVNDTSNGSDSGAIEFTAGPPDVTAAIHPLDSLWGAHDESLGAISSTLLNNATLASATHAFSGGPPDVSLIATDGHAMSAVDALGGAEIAAAGSLAAHDASDALATEAFSATRGAAAMLAPPDASLASLSMRGEHAERARTS